MFVQKCRVMFLFCSGRVFLASANILKLVRIFQIVQSAIYSAIVTHVLTPVQFSPGLYSLEPCAFLLAKYDRIETLIKHNLVTIVAVRMFHVCIFNPCSIIIFFNP